MDDECKDQVGLCEECWDYKHESEMREKIRARRAPAPEAKEEAWVPALGETVRVKSISAVSGIPSGLLMLTGIVLETPDDADERFGVEIDEVRWYVHPCDLEPAPPQPEQAAGKAVCSCSRLHDQGVDRSCPEHGLRCASPDCDDLVFREYAAAYQSDRGVVFCSKECHDAQAKPDPYAQHRANLFRKHHCGDDHAVTLTIDARPEAKSARERNIAALAKELDVGTEARKARVTHPHEGRSCRVYRENGR